jgi:Zn-dependent alcohol dehydrogenase
VTTGHRMVSLGPGRPLACWEVGVAHPGPGAVLVRSVIAGVCGSDAHRLDGDLPNPRSSRRLRARGCARTALCGQPPPS